MLKGKKPRYSIFKKLTTESKKEGRIAWRGTRVDLCYFGKKGGGGDDETGVAVSGN